jgi:glutathione S-transferase
MAIKVYGKVLSGSTALVLAAVHEKEVTDYELVDVDMMAGAHKMPDFLAMQPFGLCPVLVDGPLTLFESRAIARYIAHKFEGQGTPLCGLTPIDQALVEQWLEVEGQNYTPAVGGILREKFATFFTGEQPNEAVVSAHIEKLGKVLDVYEARLTKSKNLAGDFFSLADLAHIPTLNVLSTLNLEDEVMEGRPHVKSWWEDISSRPAWKKVSAAFQEEWAQFQAFQASPQFQAMKKSK